MANLSIVRGTLYFPKKFYKEYKELVNNWIDNYHFSDFNYGFSSLKIATNNDVNLLPDYVSVFFTGDGRWSWANTIDSLINNNVESVYFNEYQADLIKALYEEDEDVLMEYTDYECGNELFLNSQGYLTVVENKNGYLELEYVEEKIENKDFNDYTKIVSDFEDGYLLMIAEDKEALNVLIDSMYKRNKDKIQGSLYSFKKQALNYILKDEELDGGICVYHFDDEDYLINEIYRFNN